MAYGNLPGGGYTGFLKAEKPLKLKKPKYVPLKDKWPPKYLFDDDDDDRRKSSADASKRSQKTPQAKATSRRRKQAETKKTQRKRRVRFDEEDFYDSDASSVDTPSTPVGEKSEQDYDGDVSSTEQDRSISHLDDVPEDVEGIEEKDQSQIYVPEDEKGVSSEEYRDPYVKFRRSSKAPTYTLLKRKNSFLRFCCPFLDRVIYSKKSEFRGLKAMLGFPIGAIFGFGFYWLVLDRIEAQRYYFWLLGLFVGSGFALSTQVRCICFLSLPSCCGRAGRVFISTYVVAYVIQGPFTNILANTKEAMRSISCTASLNLNHSVERFNLMFKPVKEIVFDFVGAGNTVQKDTKYLKKVYSGVENEVRDENEIHKSMADIDELDNEIGGKSRSDFIQDKFPVRQKPDFGEDSEKKYSIKSEFRCEEIFTKGVRACYKSFEHAYDKCHYYLPIIGYILCWPMKLTFICKLASSLMGKRTCDSDAVINPGFGASVDTADGVQAEFDKDFQVQLQYKLKIPEERANQLVPQDVSGAMMHSYERRKKNLDFFTKLIDRFLALLVVLVLNASRKYCNQYLRVIQFDNKYVTSYFRHIDARRRKAGKAVLLPLKKLEKLELFDPYSVKFSPDEKISMVVGGLRLFSEAFTVTILLLFDRIFFELLDIIKRHSHVTYQQTGVHHIKMTIYGDGFVGNMVRGILKGFDKKHTADQVTTTEACLPLPSKLPREMVTRIGLVFCIMLVLMVLESYALRLRRVVAAFFFPKREKRRIIFLYNDRIKKRRSFLKHMRHRVRKQAREQAIAINGGVFYTLRQFYPKFFGWLSKMGLGRSKCLICNETGSKKCDVTKCPECPFSYCSECWQDSGGNCYACKPDYDTEPSDDSENEID